MKVPSPLGDLRRADRHDRRPTPPTSPAIMVAQQRPFSFMSKTGQRTALLRPWTARDRSGTVHGNLLAGICGQRANRNLRARVDRGPACCWSWPRSRTSTCRSSTSTRSMHAGNDRGPGGGGADRPDRGLRGSPACWPRPSARCATRSSRPGVAARDPQSGARGLRPSPRTVSLRFHLERQTGGLSRVIERGTQGMEFLIRFTTFNIIPTLIEIALVGGILWTLYDWRFTVGDAGRHRPLHRLLGGPVGMAHQVRALDERRRHRRQRQGDRQPAQLSRR